jgi:putative transposase
MYRGIKVRIYPTKEQEVYINKLLGSCRFIYNKFIDFFNDFYKEHRRGASSREAYQFYKRLKEEYGFLMEVHSKVISNERLIAIQAWGNFFKAKKKPPKKNGKLNFEKPVYHIKHRHDSCLFDKQAFRYIKGDRISLIKKLSNILFRCSKRDAKFLRENNESVRSVTLRRTPSGKYICSILVEDTREIRMSHSSKEIGIDLGVKHFATLSDGTKIENPRIIKSYIGKIKRLDRKLSKCKRHSRRWEKARMRLAKAYEKLSNCRKDFHHKVSSKLVKEYGTICIENLDVAYLLTICDANKDVADVTMADFLYMIRYKCGWYGRLLGVVDRFFPSSKTCNHCGNINRDLTLVEREWVCPKCGKLLDRDLNAAINILKDGKKHLVGPGSPEPNARGQECIRDDCPKGKAEEMSWAKREKNVEVNLCH